MNILEWLNLGIAILIVILVIIAALSAKCCSMKANSDKDNL